MELLLGVLLILGVIYGWLKWRGDKYAISSRLNLTSKPKWIIAVVVYLAVLLLAHFSLKWEWLWSFAVGLPLALATWLITRTILSDTVPDERRTSRFKWSNFSIPFHLWITFHVAFWALVGQLYSWDYVALWFYGKYFPFFWAMHIIYVSRGRLPEKLNNKEKFANLASGGMFLFLFWGMMINTALVVFEQTSLVERIPSQSGKPPIDSMMPGSVDPHSEELMPGQFNVWLVPEGKDPAGVLKRMEVGILPAGTKWIQVWKVGGQIFTDKLVYIFVEGRLEVRDEIWTITHGLLSPDTDGDGCLTISQSPLWLEVGDSLAGWRIVNPDRFELATALAEPTKLYVLDRKSVV